MSRKHYTVILVTSATGLVPAISSFSWMCRKKDVDARNKRGMTRAS
jgi:hypothetical protein